MTLGSILWILVLALFIVGCAVVGWLFAKRPLAVAIWATRRSLLRSGLKKLLVEAPIGPQTVFVGGSGPVLMLLHGAGDHAGTWCRVVPSLIKRYTLVIPDLAGHGESAPVTGPIQTSEIVSGLEAVITSQVAGRPMTLVGNSLGAWMAMVLASRHAATVVRVVAVNGGALKGLNEEVSLLPRTRQEARETMARLRDASSPAIPDYILDDLVRRTSSGALARFAATEATMEGWLLDAGQLGLLKMPVRLVWGVSDDLMPLDYAQRMVAALPDGELIPIERCGHIPQQEAPERFKAALWQALGEAPAPSKGAR
jgi:pimeloyl-ACP methyl ester carboxylesterase